MTLVPGILHAAGSGELGQSFSQVFNFLGAATRREKNVYAAGSGSIAPRDGICRSGKPLTSIGLGPENKLANRTRRLTESIGLGVRVCHSEKAHRNPLNKVVGECDERA